MTQTETLIESPTETPEASDEAVFVPETRVDEIALDVFRISTYIPFVSPEGFTFNQFLVRDDEPFLFHTGMRHLFPSVSAAIDGILPLDSLRWISFSHVEADECGSMNDFLAAAPSAQVVHGPLACDISLNDLADRPPFVIEPDGVLDTGSHRLRFVATPHVPHNWESGLWFDETAATLFAGDLFTNIGNGAPLVDDDLIEGAITAELLFQQTSMSPVLEPTLHRLADLGPRTLAIMHGSSYVGDGASQLLALAEAYTSLRATSS